MDSPLAVCYFILAAERSANVMRQYSAAVHIPSNHNLRSPKVSGLQPFALLLKRSTSFYAYRIWIREGDNKFSLVETTDSFRVVRKKRVLSSALIVCE
jgi:hypothetical protein